MRRRRARPETFPSEWRDLLAGRLAWWPLPERDEQSALERHVVEFLRTKRFEAARGFALTDDVPLTIAAEACLLIVGLDLRWYRDISSIIVYPSVAVRTGPRRIDGGLESDGPVALAGEAMLHGPVLIAWDRVLGAVRHPERGRNVVFHEFAHKIDMADGVADGVPPLPDRASYRRWERVMGGALADLRSGRPRGLDGYGAASPSELFAVATEAFFAVPGDLQRDEQEVYDLLRDLYRQDPAGR